MVIENVENLLKSNAENSKVVVTTSSVGGSSSPSSSSAAYDITCYYKEENEEDNHTVHAVIKKIEKQNSHEKETLNNRRQTMMRLFGCLLIIILLSSPIYGFATLYLHHRTLFDEHMIIIWTPILYSATSLLVIPWLFSSTCVAHFSYRLVIIVSTFIMSLALSISGLIFIYFKANFLLITLLYGVIGGACACVIMGKIFVIINGILNNERLYLINFIYSFAQGVTQFLLPFLIHINIRWLYFDCSSMLLISALTLHICILTLLVVKKSDGVELLKFNIEKLKTIPFDLPKAENDDDDEVGRRGNGRSRKKESRYRSDTSVSIIKDEVDSKSKKNSSFDFYPSDVLLSMDTVDWKNPSAYNNHNNIDDEDEVIKSFNNDDHFLEILDSHRVLNSDGVEILETIAEIDEEEIKLGRGSVAEEIAIPRALNTENIKSAINKRGNLRDEVDDSIFKEFLQPFTSAYAIVRRQIVDPLRRSLRIFKFYPSVILKSVDVFSYLLFITYILPNQAIKQLRFKEQENVIYLITLMGLCWILYSVIVLRFHKALKQNFIHYFHLIGLLAKIFGYLFTNQRYSLNGFLFGIVLISIGHANSLHLQETVIRNCFHPRKWHYIRGSIYSFSGFLIIVYCAIFHFFHLYFTFVTFANIFILFNLVSLLIWLFSNFDMVIMLCNMR